MTIDGAESAVGFQFSVNSFKWGMVDLDLATAFAADQVMMVLLRDFVDQMSVAYVGGAGQSVLGQELERSVNGGLRQTGGNFFGTSKHLGRRKMRTFVMKNVHDSHPLRGHAESAST